MNLLDVKEKAHNVGALIIGHKLYNFVIAVTVTITLFSVNYMVRGDDGFAFAATYSVSDYTIEDAYPQRIRRDISRKVAYNPDHVLHLSGRDVYEVLEKPELVRRDLPTVVWQYRTDACVLDIYFVTSSGANVLEEPVEYYEMRSRDGHYANLEGASAKKCMESISKPRERVSLLAAETFYNADL